MTSAITAAGDAIAGTTDPKDLTIERIDIVPVRVPLGRTFQGSLSSLICLWMMIGCDDGRVTQRRPCGRWLRIGAGGRRVDGVILSF